MQSGDAWSAASRAMKGPLPVGSKFGGSLLTGTIATPPWTALPEVSSAWVTNPTGGLEPALAPVWLATRVDSGVAPVPLVEVVGVSSSPPHARTRADAAVTLPAAI